MFQLGLVGKKLVKREKMFVNVVAIADVNVRFGLLVKQPKFLDALDVLFFVLFLDRIFSRFWFLPAPIGAFEFEVQDRKFLHDAVFIRQNEVFNIRAQNRIIRVQPGKAFEIFFVFVPQVFKLWSGHL